MSTNHDALMPPFLQAMDGALEEHPLSDHPEVETITLFALGALDKSDRAGVVQHLVRCIECRQAASLVIAKPHETLLDRYHFLPARSWLQVRVIVPVTLAAAIILTLGTIYFERSGSNVTQTERQVCESASALLDKGKYEEAREAIAKARRQGIESDRLQILESQALLQLPGPDALAYAGRLTDFGYELDGVITKEMTDRAEGRDRDSYGKAYEILARIQSEDHHLLLNRAQALLGMEKPKEALAEFKSITLQFPREPLGWLGVGLSSFMLKDYAEAEKAFRQCLFLDPQNQAAKINLAMTLEERKQFGPALELWDGLLKESLLEPEQARIRQHTTQVRRQMNR